jgi:Ca2+-binding EF-hand superfamily protein
VPNTPTATIPVDRPCIGDCNDDGQLNINELIRGVNIALGNADLATCPSFDRDGNGRVAINELIAAVTAALFGCTS